MAGRWHPPCVWPGCQYRVGAPREIQKRELALLIGEGDALRSSIARHQYHHIVQRVRGSRQMSADGAWWRKSHLHGLRSGVANQIEEPLGGRVTASLGSLGLDRVLCRRQTREARRLPGLDARRDRAMGNPPFPGAKLDRAVGATRFLSAQSEGSRASLVERHRDAFDVRGGHDDMRPPEHRRIARRNEPRKQKNPPRSWGRRIFLLPR